MARIAQLRVLALLLTAAVIFAVDTALPLGVAIGVPYILVVWLAYSLRDRRWVWWIGGLCCLLTVVGYFCSDPAQELWKAQVNRGMALFAIGLTTFLCDRILNNYFQYVYSTILETAPVGILMVDEQGDIGFANDEAAAVFGYSRNELEGVRLESLVPEEHRREHVQQRAMFVRQAVARQMREGRVVSGLRRSGDLFPVQISLKPVETGGRRYVLAAILDMTERDRLEKRLTVTNVELLRTNTDLEQFAYVASHDLRQPLRGIDNLAKWISEDAADVLPEPSRDHLRKLSARITRMEKLLDDLLEFSRAGRVATRVESFDVRDLVMDEIELLDGAEIALQGDWPTIHSSQIALATVFRNLVGNAIKHSDKSPHITIAALAGSDELAEFSVADDGPGIPDEHRERIFVIFQTLKPRDEVEGSGMGLALVKRMVESHGGKIWLETTQGRGATFRFTWPRHSKGAQNGRSEDRANPARRG